MSSYVVSKALYVKAAGFLAGIREASKRGCNEFWVYDYELHHVMEPADFYDRFVECYQMNDISVMEQYHDDEAENDEEKYMDFFMTGKKRGKEIMLNRNEAPRAIHELNDFFSQVLYQTEKEPYMFKMQMLFGNIMRALLRVLDPYQDERMGWGNLENL